MKKVSTLKLYSLFFLLLSSISFAQEDKKTNEVDTGLMVVQDSVSKKKRPPLDVLAPSKAAFYSAVLPGLGQAYNKKYWKLPIVYGGLGAMIYFIDFNTGEQKRFERAINIRKLNDLNDEKDLGIPDIPDQFPTLDNSSVISYRNQHRKQKELSYVGLLIIYVLAGVDAYVDAHLLNFDVNDDLTLRVRPDLKLLPDYNTSIGLGVGLHLSDNRDRELPVDIYGK